MIKHFCQVGQLAILELKEYYRDWLGFFWALVVPISMLFVLIEMFLPPEAKPFAVPIVIAINVAATGIFSFAMGIVDARVRGVLKTYQASALRPWQYIAAQILDRTLIVSLVTVLIFIVAKVVYGLSIQGNIVAFVGVFLLSIATMLALGSMLPTFLKTVEAAGGASMLVFLLAILSMGGMGPIDGLGLPDIAVTIIRHSPFYPIPNALIIVWMGFPGDEIWRHLAIMAVWFVVFFAIASRRFRWSV